MSHRRFVPRWRSLARRVNGRPPLIVVEVSGGVVQQVYASNSRIDVLTVDYDADGATADDGALTVWDSQGDECRCFAAQWRPVLTARLPVETRQAVEQTLRQR